MPAPDPYASLDQLKAELGITDSARDALLTRKLNAASRWVDRKCGRRFVVVADATASTRVFDLSDGRVIDHGRTVLVDDIGDLTDLVIEAGTVAGGFTALTGYDTTVGNALSDGRALESIYNPTGWPHWWGNQLRVTARWGWPAIPDDVVEATLMQAMRYFSRKDSPEGVRGSADWGLIRVSRTDPDVQDLLAPYIRQWVA